MVDILILLAEQGVFHYLNTSVISLTVGGYLGSSWFLSFLKKDYLIFGSAGSSLRHGLFPSYSDWGCSLVAVYGLLFAVASPVVEHRL